jgi:delta-aminolevulinic acid dehydratase/porphobilinogen synthase/DNA-binding Lrp family transcriptional regulator
MAFPATRLRRLRRTDTLRGLVRETELSPAHLIQPAFVVAGEGVREEVPSMPGIERFSINNLVEEAGEIAAAGIGALMLFGVPAAKDEVGSGAYDDEGIVQMAVRALKDAHPDLVVMTDVCLCEYTSHGHCGVVRDGGSEVDNDVTVELLAKTAISHAEAGADAVAPSDMMDGRIGSIRYQMDEEGHPNVPIIAYSAKYASAFYGPFRDAAESTPEFGDRRGYQMDPANAAEAVREAELDLEEGADMLMVKPALPYLDRRPGRRLPRLRRVLDAEGGRRQRLDRRARRRGRGADLDPPRRRRRDRHLLREGGSRVASVKVPQSKARSRKDGSAIPLDETDKRLMNLLQSSFPLDPEPFALVASEADLDLDDVLGRTQRLLDGRIIREITPIFDTRALGYESMLVAAKVDAENPQRAAKIVNAHPGVSHNYLRTHDFNMWFTIATPPDSKLGLKGTLEALMEETGAESMRELPTLTLFKINMNLEMEKGTEALAAPVEAAPPRELEPQPYDENDIALIKALQGPMEAVARPYDAAAQELGISTEELLDRLRGMVDRKILRRVAAILYHRRAGFSANGMGVWKVPEDQIMEVGGRMASFRGISHCYQRPTYEDWPYSVFTMAHGRSKEECDAVLDAIAAECGMGPDDRATLYSSTEYKKIRLHYFTEDYARWEAQHS